MLSTLHYIWEIEQIEIIKNKLQNYMIPKITKGNAFSFKAEIFKDNETLNIEKYDTKVFLISPMGIRHDVDIYETKSNYIICDFKENIPSLIYGLEILLSNDNEKLRLPIKEAIQIVEYSEDSDPYKTNEYNTTNNTKVILSIK